MVNFSNKKFHSPLPAYAGYLFQTFFKRPFGYIIALLYVLYLTIILLIVPSALKVQPLFIWNIAGFNMATFNLFFIAAAAASIAVAVFRTGRDDGSDLNISAKPLTKGSTVAIKTIVYLLIMIIVCVFTTIIISLIKPVFGTYDEVTNPTGITDVKYIGILLSILLGNLINMILFGGIAVFICMVGGQVVTIIGTIAIVFVMCMMNIIFPFTVKSASSILSEKYGVDMLGYSCNTLRQYKDTNADQTPLNFSSIQCSTDDSGQEELHFDTKEYWDKADAESNRLTANYFDFARQLSTLFNSFGLDQSKLKEASKLVIGTNSNYVYDIQADTHVDTKDNIDASNYPICYYDMRQRLGKVYPLVILIGGNMSISSSNWYVSTTLFGIDFNSVNYVSNSANDMLVTEPMWNIYKRPYQTMSDLSKLTAEQKNEIASLYDGALSEFELDANFPLFAKEYIHNHSTSFGSWETMSNKQQYDAISKIHLGWAVIAQKKQIEAISNYHSGSASFPFNSRQVLNWYTDEVKPKTGVYTKAQLFNKEIFTSGIAVDSNNTAYSRLTTSKMEYAETYKNLYQYKVSNFYNVNTVVAIWMIISCCLFAASVIVYKKTDFK